VRTGSNSLLCSVVEFDVFCTLTFRQEPSYDAGVRMGYRWLDAMRVACRLPDSDYYWLLRPERGEVNGRLHLHALVRVPPRFKGLFVVPVGATSVAHRMWKRGMTTFRFVDGRQDPSVLYMQKAHERNGADAYELRKTEKNFALIPSAALLKRAALQESEEGCGSGSAPGMPLASRGASA